MDSEVKNRMRELYDRLTTLNTTITTLNTTISTLNTSWNTALTAINNLTGKVPTPTNLDYIITTSSPTIGMMLYELHKSAIISGAYSTNDGIVSITTDNTYIYTYDSNSERIGRLPVDGGAYAFFWGTGTLEHSSVAFDKTNGRLLVYFQAGRTSTTHTLYDVTTGGSTTASYDVDPETTFGWTGAGEFASMRCMAWDETTGYVFVIYRKYDGSAYTSYGICAIDPDDGTIKASQSLFCMGWPRDMEIAEGYMFVTHIDTQVPIAQYVISSAGVVSIVGSVPSPIDPKDTICYDSTKIKFGMISKDGMNDGTDDWKYVWYRALAYKDRYAIEDSIVTNDAAYNNATIGATAAELVAANPAREKVIIQNDDLNRTVYVGNDSSVTTSNGLPILPMRGWNVSGYSGAIWLIADGAGADIRYLEVW